MNILSHPNIPQLLGVQITCKPYALIMEFLGEDMKSSTVHQLLQESSTKSSPLLTSEWVSVCVDIVEAVKHIHSKGYLHCDLKTNNILVLKKRGFVIDFGKVCFAAKQKAKTYTSFYNFIAPEANQLVHQAMYFLLESSFQLLAKPLATSPYTLWGNSARIPSHKFDHRSQI